MFTCDFLNNDVILRHCYIQNVKDRLRIRVYKIDKESVIHFSQFTSVKVKKVLGNLRLSFGKS